MTSFLTDEAQLPSLLERGGGVRLPFGGDLEGAERG